MIGRNLLRCLAEDLDRLDRGQLVHGHQPAVAGRVGAYQSGSPPLDGGHRHGDTTCDRCTRRSLLQLPVPRNAVACLPDGSDRHRDAHGRRPAPRRYRTRRGRVPLARAHVPRPRALRRPLRDRPPARSCSRRCSRRCSEESRYVSSTTSRTRARSPFHRRPRRPPTPSRRFRSRRAGSQAFPTSCTTSSSSATAGRLGRLDELDGRLVVEAGERHRHGRVAGDRLRVLARVHAAVGQRQRRAVGEGRSAAGGRRGSTGARVVHAGARRGALASHREAPRQGDERGSASRRPCSRPARSWPRSSRS